MNNFSKDEKDWNCSLLKLISITFFQSSFSPFVRFDIILGRHVYLTRSCDIVIYKTTK